MRKTFPKAKYTGSKGIIASVGKSSLNKRFLKYGMTLFSPEQRLALKEQDITIIDDTVLVKAGKLSITHGHHIFKGIFVPVSPARVHF